jgi:hypothetical protein
VPISVTMTLVYNDTIFLGPFDDVITEFYCICSLGLLIIWFYMASPASGLNGILATHCCHYNNVFSWYFGITDTDFHAGNKKEHNLVFHALDSSSPSALQL